MSNIPHLFNHTLPSLNNCHSHRSHAIAASELGHTELLNVLGPYRHPNTESFP